MTTPTTNQRTIREVGRIVAGGYYDHQMVRTATMNRIRDVIRHIREGIPFDQPEEKKETKSFDKRYADSNLSALIEEIFTEGKLSEEERDYLLEALELARNAAALEERHKPLMGRYVSVEVMWTDFLKPIKGIAEVLAANLIKNLASCEDYQSVSALWRHFGLHVVCPTCTEKVQTETRTKIIPLLTDSSGKCPKCGKRGIGPRPKKGRDIDYNPKLRTLAWKIANSFVNQRTPCYRDIFDAEKTRLQNQEEYPAGELFSLYGKPYTEKDTRLKPSHINNRAMRKMIKIFLQHCWVASRTFAGLDITDPYVQEKLGHVHIITWQDALKANGGTT